MIYNKLSTIGWGNKFDTFCQYLLNLAVGRLYAQENQLVYSLHNTEGSNVGNVLDFSSKAEVSDFENSSCVLVDKSAIVPSLDLEIISDLI